jgi:hypothetical protein
VLRQTNLDQHGMSFEIKLHDRIRRLSSRRGKKRMMYGEKISDFVLRVIGGKVRLVQVTPSGGDFIACKYSC